jgi:hypothetical protein
MALLVYLRLMYRASFFPAFFEGEESKVLVLAKATYDYAVYSHSWWNSIRGGMAEYNKGFSFALIPFYSHFGFDVRLITYVLPVFFSLFCAAFFTIYRKSHPRSSVLSFVLAAVFSVLCLSLRRYKWHSMMYLSAVSVYLFFLPQIQAGISPLRGRWLKVLSVLLFGLSCYFYFGCFIYFFPFLLLFLHFGDKAQRKRNQATAGAGLALFALTFFAACYSDAVWRSRITEEFAYVKADLSLRGLSQRWSATRDFFFTLDLSTPYLVLFVAGSAVTYRRMRQADGFAIVNGTLLVCLWAFELTIQGLNNPDQLNWSMIPLLGVLLAGADAFLVPIRDRLRHGQAVAAGLVLVVGANELRHYVIINRDTPYQPYVQPRNTMTQAALILMMIRDDDSGTVQYYLPDQGVPMARGGFDYSVDLLRVDFVRALSKVTFFSDEPDLRAKLAAQDPARRAIAYLSVCDTPGGPFPVDPATRPLLGQRPEIIHPYADVYDIEFLTRKFEMRPGPATRRAHGT